MAQYGMGFGWSAIQWLHDMGDAALKTLHADDHAKLRELGIINEQGEVEHDRLKLALHPQTQEENHAAH